MEIRRLSHSDDVSQFTCGDDKIDRNFRTHALANQNAGLTLTYVAVVKWIIPMALASRWDNGKALAGPAVPFPYGFFPTTYEHRLAELATVRSRRTPPRYTP